MYKLHSELYKMPRSLLLRMNRGTYNGITDETRQRHAIQLPTVISSTWM